VSPTSSKTGVALTTEAITPLRQRMVEDMNARKLCAGTQRGHIRSCKRFAAFLKRSPGTAAFEDIRRFQLHLAETGVSICTRNVIMTGLRFLFRVTLRRLDLAAEIYHLRAPQKIPLVISTDEAKRLLVVADSLKTRVMLSLSYGCGLRAGEVQSAAASLAGFRTPARKRLAPFVMGRHPKTFTKHKTRREQSQQETYSITSSAATSKPGGTVRPSAFAVLRLTTVSYLVGVCTGRSAG